MSESSDIVKFQRWLQSQLSEAESIEDPNEKKEEFKDRCRIIRNNLF